MLDRIRHGRLAAFRAGAAVLAATSGVVVGGPATVQADLPNDQVYIAVTGSSLSGVATNPTLSPTFDPHIRDYVMYCQQGVNTVAVTLTAASGTITVDGQSGASVTIHRDLSENQAAVVVAPDPDQSSTNANYWIRCLPHDFPALAVTPGPGTAPPGWYFTENFTVSTSGPTSGTYVMILDQHGTPVWYRNAPGGPVSFGPLGAAPYNRVAWAPQLGPGVGADPHGAFSEVQLDNDVISALYAPVQPTDMHELFQLPNGHMMMIGSPLRSGMDLHSLPGWSGVTSGTIVDCLIEEVDGSGALVGQVWRMSDHVSVNESTLPTRSTVHGQTVADVFHCNSIDVDPTETNPALQGDVLVSARNASAVYDITHRIGLALGPIKWKLGGTTPPLTGTDHEPLITTSAADQFLQQHDARFRPGGNISLYDDHSAQPTGHARGIEYALNLTSDTAASVFQYDGPDGQVAPFTGSFRRSTDGTDNVIGWGGRAGSGFSEVDQTGQVLLRQTFPNGEFSYRVIKVPANALNVGILRRDAGLPRPTPPPAVPGANLYGVLLQGASGGVEVHGLSQQSNFTQFSVHSGTAFGPAARADWQFSVAPYQGDKQPDLIGVHLRNTDSGQVEVHVLSAASDYNTFLLHTATPLPAVPPGQFEFTIGSLNGDHRSNLYAIELNNTGSNSVEVHVLGEADGYGSWSLHSATAMAGSYSTSDWQFRVGDPGGNGDLVGIAHTATGSGGTEIHALGRIGGYSAYTVHTATPLGYTSDSQFEFSLGDVDSDGVPDLDVIDMNGTASARTELHVLAGSFNFANWQLHAVTGLGQTDTNSWQFSAAN
jgi:hypothetical protein